MDVSGSGGTGGMASGSLMGPPRDKGGDRLERIDAMLTHLRELEKDTARIISSLQRERRLTQADTARRQIKAARGRAKSKSARSTARPKRKR